MASLEMFSMMKMKNSQITGVAAATGQACVSVMTLNLYDLICFEFSSIIASETTILNCRSVLEGTRYP